MNNERETKSSDEGFISCGDMNNVPGNVSYLAKISNETFATTTIEFFWNSQTRHGKIRNYQPPEYYQDYLMTTTCSQAMQQLQKQQSLKLRSLLPNENRDFSFVEIGCGDGSFLKHASALFAEVLGIEPSKRFASEAIANGFTVVNKYVSNSENTVPQKFDAFVSRQVFEHLPDPLDVLLGIRRLLRPGAVGLIEVPNGQRALRLGRFFEFFPDHVNYYSVNSLVDLASKAGFTVIECKEAFGQDYLELWLRYDTSAETYFSKMVENRNHICENLVNCINVLKMQGKHVAIWGAGAKTLSIMTMLSPSTLSQIAYVIDSDPHKHGCFIPNSSIPILALADARNKNIECIFILALTYLEEITLLIRDHFAPIPKIFTLNEVGEIYEIT